jgi:hypothetical protein
MPGRPVGGTPLGLPRPGRDMPRGIANGLTSEAL